MIYKVELIIHVLTEITKKYEIDAKDFEDAAVIAQENIIYSDEFANANEVKIISTTVDGEDAS